MGLVKKKIKNIFFLVSFKSVTLLFDNPTDAMKTVFLLLALIASLVCFANAAVGVSNAVQYAQTHSVNTAFDFESLICTMVGQSGAGIGGCFAGQYNQVQLTVNGTTGPFCSFSRDGAVCCLINAANAPIGGACVNPSQVVNIVPVTQYNCATPQPASVTDCPRCQVRCISSLSCSGGTDSCSLCVYNANPWGTGTYKCASPSSVKRGTDICLDEHGQEYVC